MRHIYFRSILALIWLISAIFCGISGNLIMAGLYSILCGVFLLSAHSLWKKEKEHHNEDKGVR